MRVKLKRVLSFVSAVVICGVSCVTAWFSVPVSAIGVFSPFNFYQLYQMLHGLLLGDGGGNSQTFGEWLEKNMTQTIGSGNDKHVFLLTPGEKLEDMMSEASIRLALGAACSDAGCCDSFLFGMAVPATLTAVKNAMPENVVFPALDCVDSCRLCLFDAYLLYDSWALLSIRPGGFAARYTLS